MGFLRSFHLLKNIDSNDHAVDADGDDNDNFLMILVVVMVALMVMIMLMVVMVMMVVVVEAGGRKHHPAVVRQWIKHSLRDEYGKFNIKDCGVHEA